MEILADTNFNSDLETGSRHILLVEQEPEDLRRMGDLLADQSEGPFEIQQASRMGEALVRLHEERYAAVLLDLFLPDSRGLRTFQHVMTAAPSLPIIILTGQAQEGLASLAVQNGAQDYLVKEQLTSVLLMHSIQSAIGRTRSERDRFLAASYDPLTKLPNRFLFQEMLVHALEHARRDQVRKNSNWKVAVLQFDLDHFRTINDRLGHVEGSSLVQTVANQLRNRFRRADTLARTGIDEFSLLCENLESNEEAILIAKKVQSNFQKPILLHEQAIMVTASIGIAIFPDQGENAEALLRNTDLAMRRARRYGNCYYCFTPWT
jgi:diguanylate cyclase (GGDEF)-like protein